MDIYDARGRNLMHQFVDGYAAEVYTRDYPAVNSVNATLGDGINVTNSFMKVA